MSGGKGAKSSDAATAVSRTFSGFPVVTLLESGRLPLEELAALALREGQCTTPLYRVHRWFARRLGSQFRGMLAALTLDTNKEADFWERYFGDIPLDGATVLDPFVGGGTAVVEASRCDARVIGYDIDPLAAAITRFELTAAAFDSLSADVADHCARLAATSAPWHETTLPDGRMATILHHFWVELVTCRRCSAEFEGHPHHQLAHDAAKGVQWACCRRCHAVAELPLADAELACPCGERTPVRRGPVVGGKMTCPHCGTVDDLAPRGVEPDRPPTWRLFAQEYILPNPRRATRHFKAAGEEDWARYERAAAALAEVEACDGLFAPGRAIPTSGRSDARPLNHGIRYYRDLFNTRQLLHLTTLGRMITALPDGTDKRILALAFSDHLAANCMYAGYAFGYRRLSPLFSIHGWRHITRPVELNPWLDGIGRGTFPNALAKIGRAIAFAKAPSDLDPAGTRRPARRPIGPRDGRVGTSASDVADGRCHAAIQSDSSADLGALPDGSIDLILTDPPYFDNINYSEMSDFYLAWHQALGMALAPYDDPSRAAPLLENLATVSRGDDAAREYRERLTTILGECRRVLRPSGICVFTYHHKTTRAWLALGEALARVALTCTSVLPLRGEGRGGLHSEAGTIKWDAVLVCRAAAAPRVSAGGMVIVPVGTLERATTAVRAIAARLGADDRLGFRTPDALNLLRAHLVAAATSGKGDTFRRPDDEALSLRDALARSAKILPPAAPPYDR